MQLFNTCFALLIGLCCQQLMFGFKDDTMFNTISLILQVEEARSFARYKNVWKTMRKLIDSSQSQIDCHRIFKIKRVVQPRKIVLDFIYDIRSRGVTITIAPNELGIALNCYRGLNESIAFCKSRNSSQPKKQAFFKRFAIS